MALSERRAAGGLRHSAASGLALDRVVAAMRRGSALPGDGSRLELHRIADSSLVALILCSLRANLANQAVPMGAALWQIRWGEKGGWH